MFELEEIEKRLVQEGIQKSPLSTDSIVIQTKDMGWHSIVIDVYEITVEFWFWVDDIFEVSKEDEYKHNFEGEVKNSSYNLIKGEGLAGNLEKRGFIFYRNKYVRNVEGDRHVRIDYIKRNFNIGPIVNDVKWGIKLLSDFKY